MKRDVGYALFAALMLSALAAIWALVMAPDLADPDTQVRQRGPSGSVPVLPRAPDNSDAIKQAEAVLDARDLFEAAAPADMATLQRLTTARIAPPVELVPVEPAPARRITRQTVVPPVNPPRPAPSAVPALPFSPPPAQPWTQPSVAAPQPIAPSPSVQQVVTMRDSRFPLTLRGVFPDPRTGGRAHVALPSGQIVSTGPGGVIEGFLVMRINAASIIVQGRGGPPLRLEMPGY